MKLTSLLFTATQIAVACSPIPAHLPSPDNDLGVTSATDLTEGHLLQRRICRWKTRYGCLRTDHCWSVCESFGNWCWLTTDGGKEPGEFLKCNENDDCSPDKIKGSVCAIGDIEHAGCSCHITEGEFGD